jgi:solute carrier family 25 phosphate transporter 23/24/25/41
VSDSAAWNTTKALSAGALAGALSRSVTSPLERLKVLKQVQASGDRYSGIWSALAKVTREEGIRGHWKGNGPCLAAQPRCALSCARSDE